MVSSPLDYAIDIHLIMMIMKRENLSIVSLRITYTLTCEDKVRTLSEGFRGDSLSWDNKLHTEIKTSLYTVQKHSDS